VNVAQLPPAVFRPAPLEDLVLQLDSGSEALRERMARMILAPPTSEDVAGVRRVIDGMAQIAGQLAAAVGRCDEET
jgi:hypothetical protein